jgi:hypothetical protein
VVLVAGDADKRLGMKYTNRLLQAAKDGVDEMDDKIKACVRERQWVRAFILAVRAVQAGARLGVDPFTVQGLRIMALNASRESLVIEAPAAECYPGGFGYPGVFLSYSTCLIHTPYPDILTVCLHPFQPGERHG